MHHGHTLDTVLEVSGIKSVVCTIHTSTKCCGGETGREDGRGVLSCGKKRVQV